MEKFYENNDFDYNIKDSEYIIDLFNKYDHVSFEEFLIYAKTLHSSLKTETQINQSNGNEELSVYQRLYNDYLDFYRNIITRRRTFHSHNEEIPNKLQGLLDYACYRGFERLFDFLLPKIGIKHSLLIFACGGGQLKIIKKLKTKNQDYRDGFVEACIYGKIEVVKYLFSKVDKTAIENGFIEACKFNRKEVFNFLVDKDIKIENKRQGFIYSVKNGNLELAKILYPFTNNDDKNIAFKDACLLDRIDCVKFLLDDNITNVSKKTGFINTNNIEIFNILYPFVLNDEQTLSNRFDRDCKNDNLKFVKLLFDKVKINYGVSTAAKYSSFDVLDFFIEKGVRKSDIFTYACMFNSLDVVQKYIDDIDYETLETGFAEACGNIHHDIIDFLINKIDKDIALALIEDFEVEEYVKNKIEIKK